MASPIVIERKPDNRLAPVEGDRRKLKPNETVTFERAPRLASVELRITFTGPSPFSSAAGHSFPYNTTQTVTKAFNPANASQNIYEYKCHPAGEPPSAIGGGEIEIEPGG
jgi:hypothetical protein